MRRVFVLAIVWACSLAAAAAAENEPKMRKPEAGQRLCLDCHTRPNPTKADPGLLPCPRVLQQGPEVVLLDQLSSQYVPVIFAHKLHAQMTEIAGGCVLCHHREPSGRVLPCRDCHAAASSSTNLAQPTLKGAYHRQCLNCHREWSHQTECAVCHAKRTAANGLVQLPDPTDIMGILHPNIEEPVTRLYETKSDQGHLVTFRHQEHVRRFGFKCVDCHREEGCSRCHNPDKPVLRTRTLDDHHRPCAICHETVSKDNNACQHCHSDHPIPSFDHAQTGWSLSRHHQSLKCRSCHEKTWKFTRLERDCLACHSAWEPKTFNHAVTGQILDDDHKEAACAECHLENKFDRPPACAECHEEDIQFPNKRPGEVVAQPLPP